MPTLFSRSPAPPRKDKPSTLSRRRDGAASGSGTPVDSTTSPLKPTGRTSTFSVQSRTGVAGGFQAFDAGGGGLGEFGAMQGTGAVTRTLPSTTAGPLTPPDSPTAPPLLPPKYTFLPTRVSSIAHSISSDSFQYGAEDVVGYRPYGFLGGVGSRVVLGVDDVGKVIMDVGKELARRCVTTPMLFSNQALDLNPSRTRALIQSYVESISGTSSRKADTWVQDLKFAREYELAWLFRWALSRITRYREGSRQVCHGVIEWEAYEEWRGRERASDYPLDAFPYFSAIVPSAVYHQILTPLFSLLSKFAAYSHVSGLTPHTLSSLFAPLLFDIPTSSSCMSAHTTFVRAASATEHMLLAYIRSSSNKGGLGMTDLPSRLKDWVGGYPSMVASDGDLARASPRRGARVLRCERASRTVRAYSKDLIVNAESWAADIGQQWEAWDSVVLRGRRGESGRPKFSQGWRRKISVKEMLPLPSSSSTSSELNRKISYGRAQKPGQSPPQNRRNTRAEGEEEARWGSLAGKEWSMFEEGGFDSPSQVKEELRSKLQFDLTESAKQGIAERRQTMDWSEFASSDGGFNRTDPLLDMSLTFSAPLADTITGWPRERDEIAKRLHKAHKDAVPFTYDTTPRVGSSVSQDPGSRADGKGRVYLEEAFVDCWSDWMMGGGWADREELTFKEANWVLIEYKARPLREDDVRDSDPLADPRTSDLYFLFEERVPTDYQMAIADPKQKRTFGLFSSKKKRGASSTLPRSPRAAQFDHTDFDRMLVHRDRTKKLTLGSKDAPNTAIWHVTSDINSTLKTTLPQSSVGQPLSPLRREAPRRRTRSGGRDSLEDAKMHEGKASFFSSIKKDKVLRGVKTDESMRDNYKKDKERQRAKEVDFELQSASGLSSPDDNKDGKKVKEVKGQKPKDDDKWMDILIANGARRMDRQDATAPPPKKTGPSGGLPVSPHPPRQYSPNPQALPADFDPYANGRASTDDDRGYGGMQDQAALYATHTPETSGSVDVHEAVTPDEGADLARFPSWKRKPVPPLEDVGEGTEPDEPDEPDETKATGPARAMHEEVPILGSALPPKSKDRPSPNTPPKPTARTEILSPSPTRRNDRDTINNIVDIYNRDSVLSNSTADFESSDFGESPRRSTEYAYEDHATGSSPSKVRLNGSTGTAGGSRGAGGAGGIGGAEGPGGGGMGAKGGAYDRDRLTPPDEREADDGEMKPPGVLFDLTPGREPSPARYKHGEPLSFVGEEEEVDD